MPITIRVGLKIVLHAVTFHGVLHFRFHLVQITGILQENCAFFLEPNEKEEAYSGQKRKMA